MYAVSEVVVANTQCRLKSMLDAMWGGCIQRLGWLRWNINIPVLALATLYSNTVTKSLMWILRVIYSWIYDTIVYFCFCFFLIYQILMNVMAIMEAVVMTASTKLEASTVSAHPDTSFWMIPRPVWVRSTFIRNVRGSNFVCLLITFPPFNNVFALVWSCQTFFLIIIFVWNEELLPWSSII